ncbi:MFS family transporter [Serratia plymuthica A30]|nr:MFS family transporter [Serratia plymuthica A30]
MSGFSWIISSQVSSLTELYLVYGCLGGLGTGIVYIGVVGLMVKWFPQQRGFAAGAVAAGYGMGAILTTFPISISLGSYGLDQTMMVFGGLFALVGFLASQGLKVPVNVDLQPTSTKLEQNKRQFTSKEMLRQPLFWLMFVMMAMMSTSGLMVTSQMAIFAEDFGISQAVVFGLAALPLALTLDRFTNGLTRPLFGFISDRYGREKTMFIAFALEGVAMTLWLMCREDPLLFVLLSGVVFFGWGEIFSLFPATLTDTFGSQNATANYGWLYMSQGIGSIFGGPLAALLYQHTQGWHVVFGMAISFDFITAALALWVLKPWRSRFMRQHG